MIPRKSQPPMPLFDRPREVPAARATDPGTSHAAATKVVTFRGDHHRRILAALSEPRTIYEIAQACGLDHVAVARRMPELERDGKAEPTDETRKSPSGSPCRVWRRVGGGA